MTTTTSTPGPATRVRGLLSGPGTRLAAFAALLLAMMVPLAMIADQVQDRSQRRNEAAADIAHGWGGRQSIAGPLLRVPWTEHWLEDGKDRSRVRYLILPPASLKVDAKLDSEVRKRGIFEIPVFRSKVQMSGRFAFDDPTALPVEAARLDWSRAELLVAIADPRALSPASRLEWNGHVLGLEPSAQSLSPNGVYARLQPELVGDLRDGTGDFQLQLELQGSESFSLAPVARSTTAQITSSWPHPSFQGDWLPSTKRIGDDGFTAGWTVSYLGRGYPPLWIEGEIEPARVTQTTFGVAFNVPVDPYRMAERIAKYAVLLVSLCFAALWVSELLGGRRLHPVQVMLLGASLCLFGLLQLAFAEHLGFVPAYVLAAGAVVLQASIYLRSATRSNRRAVALAAVLASWFTYLYAVLNAEDVAFLLGTLALFGALSGMMWATRRVDWSGRTQPPQQQQWDVASTTLEPGA